MISFTSDYVTGAHPEILKRLTETNMESLPGYCEDKYCSSATRKIREFCGCPDADVYYLVGGTQTNQMIISTMLKNYEGVICAKSGHINVHESGAIEYTGHKVIAIDGENGKISADAIDNYIKAFYSDGSYTHMVFPGMVYISFPTEYGTIYSKKELTDIHEICVKYNIPLFIDGARLGYGLAGEGNDVTPDDLPKLCDVFYIGGTKVGALCGEAVVFTHNNAPEYFYSQAKQHGALVAKGRLLGVQFDTLFSDGLYVQISVHAIIMAHLLKDAFTEKGYNFFIQSPTNQQFIILENGKLEELKKNVFFSVWEKYDDSHTVVRFATSWATTEEDIEELKKYL